MSTISRCSRWAATAAVLALAAGCSDATDLSLIEPAAGPSTAAVAPAGTGQLAVLQPTEGLLDLTGQPEPDLGPGTPIAFRASPTAEERALLDQHLAEPVAISGGAAADVRVARSDLNGDGLDDAIVMIHSGPYCGSGNVCNFWVFENTGAGWRAINHGEGDAANQLYLMPGSSGGYRDLGLAGQCGQEGGCSFLLRWAGTGYEWPRDPGRA